MPDAPSHECAACGYPILNAGDSDTCPECGLKLQGNLRLTTDQYYRRGISAMYFAGLAVAILGTASALAMVSPSEIHIIDVSITTTHRGWWLSTPIASIAMVTLLVRYRPSHWMVSLLCLLGVLTWTLAAIGILLHQTPKVELGLFLSAFAPIALACLFWMPYPYARRLEDRPIQVLVLVSTAIAVLGMVSYVGMLTALYFEYSRGGGLFVGPGEHRWAEHLVIGGLVTLIVGAGLNGVAITLVLSETAHMTRAQTS